MSARERMVRRLASSLGAIAVVGAAVACAPEYDTSWAPPAWPATGSIVDAAPPQPAGFAGVELVGQRIHNDDTGISARWGYLPGAAAVNSALDDVVRAAIEWQVGHSGVPYAPTPGAVGSELGDRGCRPSEVTAEASSLLPNENSTRTVVACEVVLASGAVFAERLRIVTGSGGGVLADTSTIVYGDLDSDTAGTAAALFAEPAASWTTLVEALRRDAGSLSVVPPAAPTPEQGAVIERAFASAVVSDGQIVVPLPEGFSVPELEHLPAWTPPTPEQPRWIAFAVNDVALSPLGEAVLAANGPFASPTSAGPGENHVACEIVPCVAMTLDDGPSTLTPGFLDVLGAHHAAATFYMLGIQAEMYPETVGRVSAEGHQIGNHTWDHPYLTELSDAQIRRQLEITEELLRALSGQPIDTMRPPGGKISSHVVRVADMPAIMWDIDTRDWADPDPAELVEMTVGDPVAGSIILMHDVQYVTAGAFDQIVAGLVDRGFALVTIDQMFGGTPPVGIVNHGRE